MAICDMKQEEPLRACLSVYPTQLSAIVTSVGESVGEGRVEEGGGMCMRGCEVCVCITAG